MALPSPTLTPGEQTQPSTAAIVAPGEDTPSLARALSHRGWTCLAVTLPRQAVPLAATDQPPTGAYTRVVVHENLRRTLKALRTHGVSHVVAGSALGIELADQLAEQLGLPGNDPATARLRRDRDAQACALTLAGLAAPRGLRTARLTSALRWASFCRLPAYVLAPADTSVAGPARVCRTHADIALAWHALRRAGRQQAGDRHVVIQEVIPGPHYLLHTFTRPGPQGPEHTIREIWAETRTPTGLPDRLDAICDSGLLARALRYAAFPMLQALGIQAGAYRLRIAYPPDRGPLLLSARLAPHHHLQDLTDPSSPPPRSPARLHVARVDLAAPHDGTLNGKLLRALTSLPTVSQVTDQLRPGAPVSRTVNRLTSPGQLVLTGGRRMVDTDYRVIRNLESAGLYARRRT